MLIGLIFTSKVIFEFFFLSLFDKTFKIFKDKGKSLLN